MSVSIRPVMFNNEVGIGLGSEGGYKWATGHQLIHGTVRAVTKKIFCETCHEPVREGDVIALEELKWNQGDWPGERPAEAFETKYWAYHDREGHLPTWLGNILSKRR